ncbi:hypothetical protein J4E91_004688 [Alternaria rosae]|nr:hypothetical protein J4E91_004688 [Alternaria rosae]
MQYSTVSSGAQGVPLYGYLVIGWKSPVNPYPTEFLAGFMDELSRHVYLQYNLQTEEWRSKSGTREEKVLDIDEITRIWMDTGLFENEIDAKVMVVSSLARCTVWKETQGSNISTRRPAQHPEVSRPKVPSTEVEGLQRDQTTRGASATTKAEGILYTGAATSNFSDDQPSSTAEAPIGRHFSAVQVGDDSVTSATNAEDLENQPPPSPDTPLPSTSGAIQAHADEVKRAPTSSVSEHQSTPTARTPVARSVRAPEMGESSRTGAQMAEASGE